MKHRVHLTSTAITNDVPNDLTGSYVLFYLIGEMPVVTRLALGKPFNKATLNILEKNGVSIYAKAGTLKVRLTTAQNSYYTRAKEIQSELGKLYANSARTGLSRVTYQAYSKLLENPNSHCFLVMVPLDHYSPTYNTFQIEQEVEAKVASTYGILIGNSTSEYTERDRARWGTTELKFKF